MFGGSREMRERWSVFRDWSSSWRDFVCDAVWPDVVAREMALLDGSIWRGYWVKESRASMAAMVVVVVVWPFFFFFCYFR